MTTTQTNKKLQTSNRLIYPDRLLSVSPSFCTISKDETEYYSRKLDLRGCKVISTYLVAHRHPLKNPQKKQFWRGFNYHTSVISGYGLSGVYKRADVANQINRLRALPVKYLPELATARFLYALSTSAWEIYLNKTSRNLEGALNLATYAVIDALSESSIADSQWSTTWSWNSAPPLQKNKS